MCKKDAPDLSCFLILLWLLNGPTSFNFGRILYDCLASAFISCLFVTRGDDSDTARGGFTSNNSGKRPLIPLWAEAKWHMKLLPGAGSLTTADEEEQCSGVRAQNLGQYWGLGCERYTVCWFHSFLQTLTMVAFSATVVTSLGQSPFSACLFFFPHTARTGSLYFIYWHDIKRRLKFLK